MAWSFNGFTIPGLTTRRVLTEIELEDGQSFAIGGLLDNRDTESFNKSRVWATFRSSGSCFAPARLTRTIPS